MLLRNKIISCKLILTINTLIFKHELQLILAKIGFVITRWYKFYIQNEKAWDAILEQFMSWQERWKKQGVLAMIYAWLHEPLSQRALEDQRHTVLLKQAWDDSGEVYGYRKLHDDLCDLGAWPGWRA